MISSIKKTEGIGTGNLKKTIYEGSTSIMFDVLQSSQYSMPYKSCIRELVSNSLDSIMEKKNSLGILNGTLKEEDLYLKKEGEEFKDSSFEADYYDPEWLSDNDIVKIIYIQNDTDSKDRIQFVDEGVGLGKDRLIKFFSLGFSSKRLSVTQLGNFGLGSKSLLSTNVDFYTVTSRYCGRLYKFNVYKDHIVPAIGKFSDEGKENKLHTFYNDYSCYYEDTTEKNGVIIEAEVKRHRKDDYINGIESQLGYIKNIEFIIKDKLYDKEGTSRDIKSKITFQNEDVIIGDKAYYAKPQLLLKPGPKSSNYINYGVINFEEMDLTARSGNVSFIMDINSVDVTPSRENVIWNSRTREAIKTMFIRAQGVIESIITEKLQHVTCLFEHAQVFGSLKNSSNAFGHIAELVKLIDLSAVDLKYKTFDPSSLNKADAKLDIRFLTSESSGYGSNKVFNKLNYKAAGLHSTYMGHVWNSIENSKTNNTVVYVGEVKYQNIIPYLVSKFNLNASNEINVIYITQEYYDVSISAKYDIDERLDNLYEKKKASQQLILLLEIIRLTQKNSLPIIFESQIDKAELKKAQETEELIIQSKSLTEGELAKLQDKVRVSEHQQFSYGTFYYRKAENSYRSNKILVVYRTGSQITGHLSRLYSRVPDKYALIGCGKDGYDQFIKLPHAVSINEACYTIKHGDFEATDFGRLIFKDAATLIRYFKIEGQFINIKTTDAYIEDKVEYAEDNFKRKRLEEYEVHKKA